MVPIRPNPPPKRPPPEGKATASSGTGLGGVEKELEGVNQNHCQEEELAGQRNRHARVSKQTRGQEPKPPHNPFTTKGETGINAT